MSNIILNNISISRAISNGIKATPVLTATVVEGLLVTTNKSFNLLNEGLDELNETFEEYRDTRKSTKDLRIQAAKLEAYTEYFKQLAEAKKAAEEAGLDPEIIELLLGKKK